MKAGQELVFAGYAGMDGATRLCIEREEILLKKLSSGYLNAYLEDSCECRSALEQGIKWLQERLGEENVFRMGEGGIFAGLWNMAESAGVGLEVFLKRINIKQETIEVCEVFDINPYQLNTDGCLIAADNAASLLYEMQTALNTDKAVEGFAVIGRLTGGKARTIINGTGCRFVTRPQRDEIFKVLE